MAALHLAPSSSAAPEQKLVHRPSPYMRRVRLPRLDFSIRQNAQYSHNLPHFMDNDLPSPEELIAKIELIQLKNKQINGNTNHLQQQQKRPNGIDLNGNTKIYKKKNISVTDEKEGKIISSTNSNKCAKIQQNKILNGQKNGGNEKKDGKRREKKTK